MAKWTVTFRDQRTGRLSTMEIEDKDSTGAMSTADFFKASRGTPLKAEPVKVSAK